MFEFAEYSTNHGNRFEKIMIVQTWRKSPCLISIEPLIANAKIIGSYFSLCTVEKHPPPDR